jgi:cytochrome c553
MRLFPSNSTSLLAFVTLFFVASGGKSASADEAEDNAFFEQKIRPLLIERCQECHGSKKQEGGVRLDARVAIRRGGDSGAIVPPGKEPPSDEALNESKLFQVVEYNGDIKMPPDGKLSDEQIADIRQWIAKRTPWPKERLPEDLARLEKWREHWAFKPVVSPRVPGFSDAVWAQGMPERQTALKKAKQAETKKSSSKSVTSKSAVSKSNTTSAPMGLDGPSSSGFVRTPIDAFILAKLNEQNLKPSPAASRAVLLRRLKFDLLGLPPTREEIEAFERDTSPDAFRKLVDTYLASPHYGERWGRHWLDLVRYADSNGRDMESEGQMPFAYSYRDWVVRSLNADKPYDRFLLEQIAADRLERSDDDNRDLAALGFLTLARSRDNDEVMLVADRLDVLGRTTMGLALACARCHDHKYDPIPTRDYYSLYGVLAEMKTEEIPLLSGAADRRRLDRFNNRMGELRGPMEGFVDVRRRRFIVDFEKRAGDYFRASRPGFSGVVTVGREAGQLTPPMFERARVILDDMEEPFHAVMGPWHELRQLSPEEFQQQVAAKSAEYAATKPPSVEQTESEKEATERGEPLRRLFPRVAQMFQKPPASVNEMLDRYIALFNEAIAQSIPGRERQWNEGTEPTPLADESLEAIRKMLYDDDGPLDLSVEQMVKDFRDFLPDEDHGAMEAFLGRIADLKRSAMAPAHAVIVQDPPEPVMPAVFKKGDPGNQGEQVPRQFLEFLSPEDRKPFENDTGRLELAKAIVDPKNPLTARVMVNRVWMHHMGRPLVETPSDFGMISQPPSHPELLDWLADWFVRSGWSLKKLHRLILVSNAYQQSSQAREDAVAIDPENRWLWRANRRRLDYEATYDAMLTVADQIDLSLGGPSESLFDESRGEFSKQRRALYGTIARGSTTGVASAFDFPNPSLSSARRDESLVPQQSLFFLNSHFVARISRSLADQADRAASPREKISQLFLAAFARPASEDELQACEEFLKTTADSKFDAGAMAQETWRYGSGSWNAQTKRLEGFAALEHFENDEWRPGTRVPHFKLGYTLLNREGGHAPSNPNTLAIRRWVAPQDGVVDITGKLIHEADGNPQDNPDIDGVRARVFVREAMVGSWAALRKEEETPAPRIKVKAGDVIDFAVDCRKSDSNDDFRWPVTVTWKSRVDAPESSWRQWNSVEDFSGPLVEAGEPLTPLARLAQTLLMSNEFVFVD